MKKILSVALLIALLAGFCTTAAFAARRHNFTDTDNDSICDNRNENCTNNFTDSDNDGICDNRNENCTNNFTDSDNDGICNNKMNTVKNHGKMHGANGKHAKHSH